MLNYTKLQNGNSFAAYYSLKKISLYQEIGGVNIIDLLPIELLGEKFISTFTYRKHKYRNIALGYQIITITTYFNYIFNFT